MEEQNPDQEIDFKCVYNRLTNIYLHGNCMNIVSPQGPTIPLLKEPSYG